MLIEPLEVHSYIAFWYSAITLHCLGFVERDSLWSLTLSPGETSNFLQKRVEANWIDTVNCKCNSHTHLKPC